MRTKRQILATTLGLSMLAGASAGVTAQDEADQAPLVFSGWVEPGPAVDGGWSPTIEVDDPRLAGTTYESEASSMIEGAEIRSTTWRIENEVGAWEGSYLKFLVEDGSERPHSTATAALIGEGGYDGLVALVEFDSNQGFGWAIRGVIVDADTLPTDPDPAAPFS